MPHARPHPFAWLLTAALAPAIVAATLAPDRAPAFALYWNPIYRAEVAALAVLAIAYVLTITGWMAWNGQAFRRVELPGGTVLERDAVELEASATDFKGFRDSTVERLDALETSAGEVLERLARMERRSTRRE